MIDVNKIQGYFGKRVFMDCNLIVGEESKYLGYEMYDKSRSTSGILCAMESTGRNVVPYFESGYYLNLDTMNIIFKGYKNAVNPIAMPLKVFIEDGLNMGFNRKVLLLGIERYLLGCKREDRFRGVFNMGSIVARTITEGDNVEEIYYLRPLKELYKTRVIGMDGNIKWLDKWKGSITSMSKFDKTEYEYGSVEKIKELLRVVGKDYTFMSVLECDENKLKKIVEALGIQDMSKETLRCIKTLQSKYLTDVDKYRDGDWKLMEKNVDMGRVVDRINKVVGKGGRING